MAPTLVLAVRAAVVSRNHSISKRFHPVRRFAAQFSSPSSWRRGEKFRRRSAGFSNHCSEGLVGPSMSVIEVAYAKPGGAAARVAVHSPCDGGPA